MKNSLNIKLAILLLFTTFPLRGIADGGNELPIPPISGWSALKWGMNNDQISKATKSKLSPLDKTDRFYIGNVSFYGYDANADIRLSNDEGLYEIRFIVWNVNKANALEAMKLLHGQLEANLGRPSADDSDKQDPKEFKTLWCTPDWSVFLESIPMFPVDKSGPIPGISVTYLKKNTCK
jgi:hypothetical protein